MTTKKHKRLKSRLVHKARSFTIFNEKVKLPNGIISDRDILRHPGAIIVLPVCNDGDILITRQYRPAIGDYLMEFPAGTLEPGEDPLKCAKRELIEETSHSAKKWTSLGIQYPAPGFCDEIQYLYLARQLTAVPGQLDEDEIIEVKKYSLKQLEKLIKTNKLLCAKSLAILMKARVLKLI